MKTQIKNLINGQKYVVRDEANPKYLNAPRATSHDGFGGTAWEKRFALAERVFAENGESLPVDVRGVRLTLKLGTSESGKTRWYSAEVTQAQANAICGFHAEHRWFGACEGYWSFRIGDDLCCKVSSFARRTPGSHWEARTWLNIDEAFVTILEEEA